MSSLGTYLRELRERRGVSLEEIARTTRVGRPSLEALEAGDFSKLPAPVFTRGFAVAYCQALGEPADEALARYAGRASAEDAPAPPAGPVRQRAATRGRGPVLVSFVLLIVLGVALFGVTLVLQAGRETPPARRADARRGFDEGARAGEPRRDVPSAVASPAPVAPPAPSSGVAAAVVDASRASTTTQGVASPSGPAVVAPPPPGPPRLSPASPARSPSPEPPVAPPPATITQQEISAAVGGVTAPYHLVARTTAPTWMRVRSDDGRQSDETIPAGQVREWVSNRPFTVSIGNAGGVRLELNGRALPPLGASGAVITRVGVPAEAP